MPCWHIDEETHSLASVNTRKFLQLKGETCPSKIDHDKSHPLLNLQLSQQPHEKSNV